MYKHIAAAALALVLTAPAAASGWKLVFSDDFNGTALDRQKWATRYIYNGETLDHLNDELEHYRDNDNHQVQGGTLSLIARSTGADAYESGLIRSRQTFYYGYFETRVWLPKGRGVWPAFWLNSDYDAAGNTHWPPEIDVFEYPVNGIDDRDTMFHAAGHPAVASAPADTFYADRDYALRLKSFVGRTPLNQGWHVFGLAWQPDRFTVFIDGKRIVTKQFAWTYKDGKLAGPAHVLLNFAVGGHWAGRYGVDRQLFPQAMKVDYVHVCQIDLGGAGQRQCGGSAYTPDPAAFGYKTEWNDLPKPDLGKAVVNASAGSIKFKAPIDVPNYPVAPRRLHFTAVADSSQHIVGETFVPLNANNQQLIVPAEIRLGGGAGRGAVSLFAEIQSQDTDFTKPAPIKCSGLVAAVKATKCLIGRAFAGS